MLEERAATGGQLGQVPDVSDPLFGPIPPGQTTGGPLGQVPGTDAYTSQMEQSADDANAAFGRIPPGQTGGQLGQLPMGGAMDYVPMGGALSMLGGPGGPLGQVPGTDAYTRRNRQSGDDANAAYRSMGAYGR